MKRERVYVVEQKRFRTWHPAPLTACGFRFLGAAKIRCRDLAARFPGADYRVVAYGRGVGDGKTLLVVKGSSDAG